MFEALDEELGEDQGILNPYVVAVGWHYPRSYASA